MSGDTIFALSSGRVPAGVAVVRVSGPGAGQVVSELCGSVAPRKACLRQIRDGGDLLDEGLILWFPGPASFTGEDIAEFHLHGSRAVVSALFDSFAKRGLRPARPGEFARRAFLAGKLDLVEAEGLADLIAAETEAQRRQAVGQAHGAASQVIERWREDILRARAEVEARLDFSDEGDVTETVPSRLWEQISRIATDMDAALASKAGERIREGFRVVILGSPNVGKSTLLNRLAQREVAIATAEPGTTRDVLEVALDLGGIPVVLYDTAGLRETESAVERIGIERAISVAGDADLVLWLSDAEDGGATGVEISAPVWRIRTKSDLGAHGCGTCDLMLSAVTGDGVDELVSRLRAEFEELVPAEAAVITRARHRAALQDASGALKDALRGGPEEVIADHLRVASDAVGRVTGRVGVEDVLDRIFSEFCIGK